MDRDRQAETNVLWNDAIIISMKTLSLNLHPVLEFICRGCLQRTKQVVTNIIA